MSFNVRPLHELFKTKEDRFAVYKFLTAGMKKDSYGLYNDLLQAYCKGDVAAPDVHVYMGENKLADLSERTGISTLNLKQMLFCSLRSRYGAAGSESKSPYECATEDELDELGRGMFGDVWKEHTMMNVLKVDGNWTADSAYGDYGKVRDESGVGAHLTEPFVYREMLPPDISELTEEYAKFALSAEVALVRTGTIVKYYHGKRVNQDFMRKCLKPYLNGAESVEGKDILREIEDLFAANLFCVRVLVFRDHSNYYGHFRYKGSLSYEFTELVLPLYAGYLRYGDFWDILKHTFVSYIKYQGASPAVRLLRGDAEAYETDMMSRRSDMDKNLDFVAEYVLRPVVTDTWRDTVTDVELERTLTSEYVGGYHVGKGAKERIYIVQTREVGVPDGHSLSAKLPIYWYTDGCHRGESLSCNIEGLPEGISRSEIPRTVLEYTGYFCGCHLIELRQATADIITRVLVTSSCYISVLRRLGIELYFAFRKEESEGDDLVLYVDNPEDEEFCRSRAEALGVELGGKNKLVMLQKHQIPESEAWGLTGKDQLTKEELFYELLRVNLLSRMYTCKSVQGAYKSFPLYSFIHDVADTDMEPCLFNGAGDMLTRCALSVDSVTAVGIRGKYGLFADTLRVEPYTGDTVEKLASVDLGELEHTGKVFYFYPAEVLGVQLTATPTKRSAMLPLLVNEGYCKYVRWEEIPTIVPVVKEDWEYVNALSRGTLRKLMGPMYGLVL